MLCDKSQKVARSENRAANNDRQLNSTMLWGLRSLDLKIATFQVLYHLSQDIFLSVFSSHPSAVWWYNRWGLSCSSCWDIFQPGRCLFCSNTHTQTHTLHSHNRQLSSSESLQQPPNLFLSLPPPANTQMFSCRPFTYFSHGPSFQSKCLKIMIQLIHGTHLFRDGQEKEMRKCL